jgi:hypothetical protein
MGKKSGSTRDEQPGSYFRELRTNVFGLKYLNVLMRILDPESGTEKIRIWGPGINIPDPQHCPEPDPQH